ncbi:MAG: hypothetical protein M3440_11995 [Chloroflexota bacterium]|nr:hypothetical protein [Chloroflexota bacterium]
MPELRDATVVVGVAGINGTGLTSAEKTTITNDTTALKAVTYITQTASSTLSAEQALSTLPTGLVKVTTGTGVLSTAAAADLPAHNHTGVVVAASFLIDGGGSTITTGVKGDLEIPFSCTITNVRMFADQTGSIIVDIWKDTYANYPPTSGDIVLTPSIASSNKSSTNPLAVTAAAGDILRFSVASVTTIQRVTISLTMTRSV